MRKGGLLIPKNMGIPLVLAFTTNAIAYYGSRLLTKSRFHYDLSGSMDEKIPFLSWTVIIYWGAFAFWAVNYLIGCRQSQEKAFRFMSADFVAKLACMFCFLVLPTTNIRPAVEGNSIWDELVKVLYRVDAADNLFPSIHCLTSGFGFIAVKDNENVPRWYRVVSFWAAVSICFSTLTTKQHILIDVIAGIGLSWLSWHFVEKSGFSQWYAHIVSMVNTEMAKRRKARE